MIANMQTRALFLRIMLINRIKTGREYIILVERCVISVFVGTIIQRWGRKGGREEGRWDIVSRDNNSTMIEQGRNANHVYAFMNLQ